MAGTWRIIREDPFVPVPGSPKIAKDVPLALEPAAGDVLVLERPDENLDGNFLVVRRIISPTEVTIAVRAYEDEES